jgi:hypothetical protein
MAANISFHPAPGLGDLMPGWFAVPQNSVTNRGPGGPVTYTPTIGDILPGSFVVPQNPIKDYTKGQVKLIGQSNPSAPGMINGKPVTGMGDCGCGCGGGGGCGGGLGQITVAGLTFNPSADITQIGNDINAGNIMNVFTDTFLNVPVWVYAALLAVYVTTGGKNSHVSRARRAVASY